MMTFLVGCLLRPDAQKKARNEIDAVVGRERLPTFEDRPRLPFVDAICKEVLRWRPVTPLGASRDVPNPDGVLNYFHGS